MKKEATDLAGNDYIKDKNGKVVFAEDGRKRVWKEHMKAIMNEENPGDGVVNVEVVEGPMEPFAMNEVESTRDHEKCQGQWTNWNCQRAPSCFSTW